MPAWLNALLCAFVGAVGTHLTYVQANLFILHDTTRRGRHIVWDPSFFDGLGLLWGVAVGSLCAVWLGAASPIKAVLAGLGITVAGIAIVGAATTYQRYRELPREPLLEGPRVELEFEVRLPLDRDPSLQLPVRAVLNPADENIETRLARQPSASEGRAVLVGRLRLRSAGSPRLITVDDQTAWNFMLPLAAVPTTADETWTDWAVAVNAPVGLPSERVFQIRYRVRFGVPSR